MTNKTNKLKILSWPLCDTSSLVVGTIALLTIAVAMAGESYIYLARTGAVTALLAQMFVELRQGQKRFLTSPLFLLSTIGTVFFSVLQGILGPKTPWPNKDKDFTLFIGSQAEGIILVFCMACLVFYLFASRSRHIEKPLAQHGEISNRLIILLFILTAVISLFDIIIFSLNGSQILVPSFIAKAHFIAPPLIAFCLCLLIHDLPRRGKTFKLAVFLLAIAALGGLAYVKEGKIVIFMLLAISAYTIRLFNFSFSRLLLAFMVVLLITLAFAHIIQRTRWLPSGMSTTKLDYYNNFASKVLWRQTDTGYCLNNVLKAHAKDPFEISKQLFWLKGLVPRILWPDKPSLSQGKKYAVNYCSRKLAALGNHSSSITLLGQPIIQGGMIGLIIHAGLLLLGLAVVEKFNANPDALPNVMVVAILPWLIDFDQDFAMYIANAVKFSMVMAVLFVPIAIIERSSPTASPPRENL